jgi:TP901 family phage tail tape measure protein
MAADDLRIGVVLDPASLDALRRNLQASLSNIPASINPTVKGVPSITSSAGGGGGGGTSGRLFGGGGSGGSSLPVGPLPSVDGAKLAQVRTEIDKTISSLGKMEAAHGANAKAADTFAERIGFTTTRLAAYLIPASAIFQLSRAFGTASESIKEINADINKLTQILDGNSEKANRIADSVLSTAVKYGQSGKEILKITNTLAQAGAQFSSESSLKKAVETLAKTNLTATFGSIQESTEGAIAALNQFNLSGDRFVEIFDVADQLAKKFAFESGDLFTAVKTGGAAFSVAGGNLKEFAATVSTLRQLTRVSAPTIGTGLNTISLNLLRPEVIRFTDLLTNGKTREADGRLKGIKERLVEIALAAKNLNDEELGGIAEKISGVRQGKLLVPLLRDIAKGDGSSIFSQNLEQADVSAGSFSRDAAIGLQRIDVQLQRIGARFDEVFKKFSESQGIKELVKDFAVLATTVADAVQVLGPFIPILIRFAAIKLGFSVLTSIPGIVRGVKNFQESNGAVGARASAGIVAGPETARTVEEVIVRNRALASSGKPSAFRIPDPTGGTISKGSKSSFSGLFGIPNFTAGGSFRPFSGQTVGEELASQNIFSNGSSGRSLAGIERELLNIQTTKRVVEDSVKDIKIKAEATQGVRKAIDTTANARLLAITQDYTDEIF